MTMKTDIFRVRFMAPLLAMLCAGAAAQAHHSVSSEFDQKQPLTFTGTIQKVIWLNPHIYTLVEVKSAEGKAVVYRIEGGSPNALYRQGWRKDSLKVGDVVKVTGSRARNPESMNVGQATITAADGRRIFTGNGPALAQAAEQ
jgi:hypothetical protein